MNSITHDSELLSQRMAAVAVPDSSTFFTVRDENDEPLVFSLGTDKKFYMIKKNDLGQDIVRDFGSLLHFDEDYVGHAVIVSQDSDDKLYIVVAVESDKEAKNDADQKASDVGVLKPFRPVDRDLNSTSDLRDLIIPQSGGVSNQRICSFFTVSKTFLRVTYYLASSYFFLIIPPPLRNKACLYHS